MSGLPSDQAVNGLAPTSLGGGLTSDLGEGVLSKAGIEDSVRDLVAVEKPISLSGYHLLRGKKTYAILSG